ncbi:MAG: PAS domain-containing sensor histidine kinase [Chitinophagaceae bacterium]
MPVSSSQNGFTILSEILQAYQLAVNEAAIVSITDPGGKILYVNDKFVEISKYSAEELIGKTHRVINSGFHPDSFFREMWQTILSGKNWRAEIRNKAKDGTYYWVDTVIAPVLDQEGNIFQYLSIRNLITVQKENEEKLINIQNELKKGNQLLKDAQHMAKAGSWYLDISANLLEWSDETYNIFEVPAGTPVTFGSFLEKLHPGDQVWVNQAWNEALKKGVYEIAHRIITKSGDKWVREWARFKFDGSHTPISASGTIQDITEKKKAEFELIKSKKIIEESEQKFRAITNQATEGIGLADADGNYKFVNPAFCAMTGYTEEELLRMTLFDLTANAQPYSVFLESKGERQRLPVEVNLRRKDGSEFMTEIIGANIEIAGQDLVLGTVRDISERKNAENKLLASEIRYRRLFEAAKDGILILDGDTSAIEDVNPFLMELLSYSREELMGKQLWEIGLFKDIAANKDIILKLQEEKYVRYENLPLQTKSGQPIWVEFVSNKYEVNGRPVIQCNIRDITARKLAEEKLMKSEEEVRKNQIRYQAMVENIDSIISLVDENFKLIYRSPSAERISGWSGEEMDDRGIPGITHPDDLPLMKRVMDKLLNNPGLLIPVSTRVKNKDGRDMSLEGTAINLLHDNNIKAIIINVRDVTERKKTEQQLIESENRLRTIVQTEPECVKILNSKGEVLSMNPAGLAMVEAEHEAEVLGRQMRELVDPQYKNAFGQFAKKVFKGASGKLEFGITGLKGGHRWLETHAVPLRDSNGKIISLLGVTRDITERKKVEEKIGNTAEELRLLAAHLQSIREEERKRIGREIHDELGQQITAIKMDIAWIDKRITADNPLLKNKLHNVIQLLDGSNRSIRRILSELRPGVLDDRGLLESLDWLGRQLTENTGIPVKLTSDETEIKLPESIATCIFRVCQEAFTNIIRYAGAHHVWISLSIHDDSITVKIEDDGKGFDPSAVQSNKSFGILGMKERVLSLSGKFELLSTPGEGTKIMINLPVPSNH